MLSSKSSIALVWRSLFSTKSSDSTTHFAILKVYILFLFFSFSNIWTYLLYYINLGYLRPSVSELLSICASLSSSRLILSEHGRNDIRQKVRLNIGIDDVTYALKGMWKCPILIFKFLISYKYIVSYLVFITASF